MVFSVHKGRVVLCVFSQANRRECAHGHLRWVTLKQSGRYVYLVFW